MAIGYNTFERKQLIKFYAVFINIDRTIPNSIEDPVITIQRWDGSQLITILGSEAMTHVADNKYVYTWQTLEDTILDTYIVSYSGIVDGLPFHDSIEIVLTIDTHTPPRPEGVGAVIEIPEVEMPEPEDLNKPSGIKAYVEESS